MVFNLVFANNIILSCFFLSFLIVDLSILAITAQILNPFAELVIPKGIPTKEPKGGIETQLVTAEAKIGKC